MAKDQRKKRKSRYSSGNTPEKTMKGRVKQQKLDEFVVNSQEAQESMSQQEDLHTNSMPSHEIMTTEEGESEDMTRQKQSASIDDVIELIKSQSKSQSSELQKVRSALECILDNQENINERISSIENRFASFDLRLVNQGKAIDFVQENVKDLKNENKVLKEKVSRMETQLVSLDEQTNILERKSRERNLRLVGVPEREGENCTIIAHQVMLKFTEDAVIEAAHRTGKHKVKEGRRQHRQIIFRVKSLDHKILALKLQRQRLANENYHLINDLTKADLEKKRKLQPVMEKARAEGKKAVFARGNVFIEGRLYREGKDINAEQDKMPNSLRYHNPRDQYPVTQSNKEISQAAASGTSYSSSYSLPPPITSPSQSRRPPPSQQYVGTHHPTGDQHSKGGQFTRGTWQPQRHSRFVPPRLQQSSKQSSAVVSSRQQSSAVASSHQQSSKQLGDFQEDIASGFGTLYNSLSAAISSVSPSVTATCNTQGSQCSHTSEDISVKRHEVTSVCVPDDNSVATSQCTSRSKDGASSMGLDIHHVARERSSSISSESDMSLLISQQTSQDIGVATVRERVRATVRKITGASSLGENMGASSVSEHTKCSETKSSSVNENSESTLADNNTTCSEDIISHL